ncbi:MAG: lysophospholipid acyltransferase family protein [Acidimicrobiales bacterium]
MDDPAPESSPPEAAQAPAGAANESGSVLEGRAREAGGRLAQRHDLGPPTRGALALYAVVRGAVAGFCRVFWRLDISGADHLPRDTPFILAPVHRSNIDTLLVAAITRRRMRYMGKATLWKYRWFGWLITALGAFPVRRGSADREALRICQEVLENGEPLVVFPEGTRQVGPLVEKVFDGPAYLAAKMDVPLIPVGIGGSERAMPKGSKLLRPVRTVVIVGEPMRAEPSATGRVTRSSVRRLSERLLSEVQRLFDEAQAAA